MGYEIRRWDVEVRVSRHNSPDDKADDAAWARLFAKLEACVVEAAAEDPRLLHMDLTHGGSLR